MTNRVEEYLKNPSPKLKQSLTSEEIRFIDRTKKVPVKKVAPKKDD